MAAGIGGDEDEEEMKSPVEEIMGSYVSYVLRSHRQLVPSFYYFGGERFHLGHRFPVLIPVCVRNDSIAYGQGSVLAITALVATPIPLDKR